MPDTQPTATIAGQSIALHVTGYPDVPNRWGSGRIRVTALRLDYGNSRTPNGRHAFVTGVWVREDGEVTDAPLDQYYDAHDGDTSSWPDWVADLAKTHTPAALPSPPPDQTALRDRIAAALYERERPPRDPHWPDAFAADREVFKAMADAVLSVLPPSADRAAVLGEASRAIEAQQDREEATELAQHGELDHETEIGRGYVLASAALLRRLATEAQQQPECSDPIECSHEAALGEAQQEAKRLGLMVDEYGAGASALTDKLKRVRDLHRETCIVARAKAQSGAFVCGMCVVLDAPAMPLQPADEAQRPDTESQHTGGNAEDCPACTRHGIDTLSYPWTCPGPETTETRQDEAQQLTPCTCRQAVHAREHKTPVDGCPWCTPAPDIRPNRPAAARAVDVVTLPDHTAAEET